jgi:hypothetical protein
VLSFAPRFESIPAESETPATIHEPSPSEPLETVATESSDTASAATEAVEKSALPIVAEIHATEDGKPDVEPSEAEAPPEVDAPPVEQAPSHQIEGRIVGNVALVEAVVMLGPDNILREAARVKPDPDGTWSVDGLDPGRYRIELDGGGDRVLVAEPLFLMVDIGQTATRVPEIRAVRSF